ncbi:hypothetical protein ES703_99394 [subsurface metagenome]
MTPAPTTYHQRISKSLEWELLKLEEKGLGEVLDAPIDVFPYLINLPSSAFRSSNARRQLRQRRKPHDFFHNPRKQFYNR